jgi:hypothetical protein
MRSVASLAAVLSESTMRSFSSSVMRFQSNGSGAERSSVPSGLYQSMR